MLTQWKRLDSMAASAHIRDRSACTRVMPLRCPPQSTMRSATLGGRSRCSPVGRCPRATPAMCRERRVLEVVHTVFSRGVTVTTGLVVSRGWALTHVTSSTTTDPNSEHQGLHLLAVSAPRTGGRLPLSAADAAAFDGIRHGALLVWSASDHVATAESGTMRMAVARLP